MRPKELVSQTRMAAIRPQETKEEAMLNKPRTKVARRARIIQRIREQIINRIKQTSLQLNNSKQTAKCSHSSSQRASLLRLLSRARSSFQTEQTLLELKRWRCQLEALPISARARRLLPCRPRCSFQLDRRPTNPSHRNWWTMSTTPRCSRNHLAWVDRKRQHSQEARLLVEVA